MKDSSNIQKLVDYRSLFIHHKIDWIEMCGCERNNKYYVFDNETMSNCLFGIKESTSYCQRHCVSGNIREMKLNFFGGISLSDNMTDLSKKPFAIIDKPYRCDGCCYGGPEMTGYVDGEMEKSVGRIHKEWTWYDKILRVYDDNSKIIYSITTKCCTCGFVCHKGCGYDKPANFYIFKGDEIQFDDKSGHVGTIVKCAMTYISLYHDSNNFSINFPRDASAHERFLLIGATLLIDYCFFEDEGKKN
jgi:hypothetical protein